MKPETIHSRISDHGRGLGTITQEMVEERAREVALTNGRRPEQFNEDDLLQAREELQGIKSGPAATDATGENVGEWSDIPGEGARQRTTKGARDPQVMAEQMVAEGSEEALHEQMVEGNKRSREADQI